MSSKQNKKTVKPMSLEDQIKQLEYAVRISATIADPSCLIPSKVAHAILVTLKRLPKGVD